MRKATLNEFKQHCVRPQRVVWAVAEHDGRRSICPLGWKMTTSGNPPMMAISVAPARYTHGLIAGSGEFVLAWPGRDLAEATQYCGTHSGRNVDKFKEAKLTPLTGEHVRAPLVKECLCNLECRLAGQIESGDHTIFVGQILAVWLNEDPKPLLCLVDASSGYETVLDAPGYRYGIVRR